jgi:hypothetical protein
MRVTLEAQTRPATDAATHRHYCEVYPTNPHEEALPSDGPPLHVTAFCISRAFAVNKAREWCGANSHTVAYVY